MALAENPTAAVADQVQTLKHCGNIVQRCAVEREILLPAFHIMQFTIVVTPSGFFRQSICDST
jgi:hypothetical protein